MPTQKLELVGLLLPGGEPIRRGSINSSNSRFKVIAYTLNPAGAEILPVNGRWIIVTQDNKENDKSFSRNDAKKEP